MKLLVLVDYLREDMFDVKGGEVTLNFYKSEVGKNIKKIYRKSSTIMRDGLHKAIDISNVDFDMYFFYDKVVNPSKIKAKYKTERLEAFKNYVLEHKPDIIVSYGAEANNPLIKAYGVSSSEFELQQLKISDDYQPYISLNPALTRLNYLGYNDQDRILIENRMVNRFIKGEGSEVTPAFGKYKMLTDFDDVKVLFQETLPKQGLLALDFETNTVQTYLDGAKAIMLSVSWKEHQGISIPLEHKLYPDLWTKEEFDYIIDHIKKLFMSPQPKVLHNGIYDTTMLMNIYGLEYTQNCADSLLMYYVIRQENPKAQKGLKHLAYMYTDMGGYENDRDVFFDNYLKQDYDAWYEKEEQRLIEEMDKENAETGKSKKPKKPAKSHYVPPLNDVDNSKLNFEWIPIDVLYKYAAADTDVTLQLYHIFLKQVDKKESWHNLIFNFYPKLVDSLAFVSHTGFNTSWDKFQKYDKAYKKMLEKITNDMYESTPEIKEYENQNLADLKKRHELLSIKPADRTDEELAFIKEKAKLMGKDTDGTPKWKFKPSSSTKKAYILYHQLGYELPPEKDYVLPKVAAGNKLSHPEKLVWSDFKSDKDKALPYIFKQYNDPLAKNLIEYAQVNKIVSSVINSYPDYMDSNHMLHPNYVPTGTPTSRLSSVAINAQNIPKPSHDPNSMYYNYPIKGLFTSRFDDGIIINVDYKSLEIFVAALVSKDVNLMQALMDGADIHRRNASIAFGVKPDDVTDKQRFAAKSVN